MVVESGQRVGDFRARVTLFSGNGTLEIRADGFSAKFVNPVGTGDIDIIKNCILLTHDALSDLTNDNVNFKEETVSARIYVELLDAPFDGHLFLRELCGESKCFGALDVPARVEVVPGFQIELLQDEEKWMFSFNLGRSYRSQSELFALTTTRFNDGNPFQTIDQKAEHAATLIKAAFARAELQTQPVEKA